MRRTRFHGMTKPSRTLLSTLFQPVWQGTISFGGQTINFVRGLTEVTLTITNTETGEVTEIIVPTFVDVN